MDKFILHITKFSILSLLLSGCSYGFYKMPMDQDGVVSIEIYRASADYAPLFVVVDNKKYEVSAQNIGNAVTDVGPMAPLALPIGASVTFEFQTQLGTQYSPSIEPEHINTRVTRYGLQLDGNSAKQKQAPMFETCEARTSINTDKIATIKLYFGVSDKTCVISLKNLDHD